MSILRVGELLSKFDLKIKEALHIKCATKSFSSHPFTIASALLALFCLCLFFVALFCICLSSTIFIISDANSQDLLLS